MKVIPFIKELFRNSQCENIVVVSPSVRHSEWLAMRVLNDINGPDIIHSVKRIIKNERCTIDFMTIREAGFVRCYSSRKAVLVVENAGHMYLGEFQRYIQPEIEQGCPVYLDLDGVEYSEESFFGPLLPYTTEEHQKKILLEMKHRSSLSLATVSHAVSLIPN